MAVRGFFYNANGLNDRERMYNGKDMNEDKAPFYKEGVAFGHLAVTAGEGMEVKVDGGERTGYAYINLHTIHNTTELKLQISQAGGSLPRIDRVVLRNDETERKPSIYILEGEYSSTPHPAELMNTATIQEKCLAEIYVAAGAVEITQADIKDTRADNVVCGFIASQFTELNFSQLTLQFDAWFAQEKDSIAEEQEEFLKEYRELTQAFVEGQQVYTNDQKEKWEKWFSGAQEILAKTENGTLLEEVKRLYEEEINPYINLLGETDISEIGDGTITGAISALNTGINSANTEVEELKTLIDIVKSAMGGFKAYPDVLTQAEYNALATKEDKTFYVIVG